METTDQLKSFFTEHWKYMAVSTACKLNIFDAVLLAPKTAKQLATELKLNYTSTIQLLNALSNLGFLQNEDNLYSLTEISLYLSENHPQSFKYACMNWSDEHMDAWQQLSYSIQTGESSFEKMYGIPYFEYLNANPDKLHNYHKAMFEYAREDYKFLPDLIDWQQHNTLIDVGGGYGAAINVIKQKHPQIDCCLFDLELVIKNVNLQDVKTLGGNFFESIPGSYNAIILSRILHDWEDKKVNIILQNCRKALPFKGTLYVIENCVTTNNNSLSLLSINMLAMCKSFERSEAEYVKLCRAAGFTYQSKKQLNTLQTILIFQK